MKFNENFSSPAFILEPIAFLKTTTGINMPKAVGFKRRKDLKKSLGR